MVFSHPEDIASTRPADFLQHWMLIVLLRKHIFIPLFLYILYNHNNFQVIRVSLTSVLNVQAFKILENLQYTDF